MKSKVVLITGASSGIGKAIGLYLTARGFMVYGTTRSLEKHEEFYDFPLLKMEVTDERSIERALEDIIQKEGRVDIVINNAGVGITGAIEETPHQEIQKVFDTNFNGALHVIKAVMPIMRRQESGLVINITSIAGYMGLPYRGIYSATKGALELVTEALRMEVKNFGVHVTSLAPGDFATNIAAGRYHAPLLKNSPYAGAYASTLKEINEGVNAGEDPVLVAKTVLKIISAKKPKVHYKVGTFAQRLSILLKVLLPDKLFEKLLLKHYKL